MPTAAAFRQREAAEPEADLMQVETVFCCKAERGCALVGRVSRGDGSDRQMYGVHINLVWTCFEVTQC